MLLEKLTEKRKKFIGDVGLNIIASLILTGTLQLAIYPYLGYVFDSDTYGSILLLMGIVNMFGTVFGTSINNARLIKNTNYVKEALEGDFNLLFIFSLIANFLCVFIISKIFEKSISNNECFLISILSVLVAIRAYYSVEYRLKLNYKHVLIMHILHALGSLGGLALVKFSGIWEWAFLIGEGVSIIYLLLTTNIYREPYHYTKLILPTLQTLLILIFTLLLSNSITYLDRLFLYPMFGGNDVSIYTVASFFGKTLGLVMMPISSVLLSYYAKRETMAVKTFKMQIIIVTICCVAFYLISITGLSVWFTGLLYPKLIDQAKDYIVLANLAAIISVGASILAAPVLKFCHTGWQILIYTVHVGLYLGLGILLSEIWGLTGFCWAAVISNFIKVFIISGIGIKKLDIS